MENNITVKHNKIDKQQIISKLEPVLQAMPEITFAYIFGSVSKGTAGPLSDIDIAVYLDPSYRHISAGYGYKSEIISELSQLLAKKVDVVILNQASTLLKHRVISNGILIFSRSKEERRVFHENTVRNYLDLKPLYKVQQEYLHKRLSSSTPGGV